MPSVSDAVTRLGGVATLAELRGAGFSDDAVQRAVGTSIVRVRHGVYATTDAHPRVVSAARVGGAVAAASAAPFRHLWEPPHHKLYVSARRGVRLRHPASGRPLHPRDPVRVLRDGNSLAAGERAVVSVVRCLAQCIRLEERGRAIAMLDSALREVRDGTVLVRPAFPPAILEEVRALLPQRLSCIVDEADARAESGSESIARVGYADAGIVAIPQVEVTADIRVDLLIGDRLVVEIGSFQHHGSREAYEDDTARRATLTRLGFVVLDFTYRQVLYDWETVLATTRSAMARGEHIGRRVSW